MSVARKNKDAAMARWLPPAPRSWNGCGAGTRRATARLGTGWRRELLARQDFGLLGGVLAARLGYGTYGVPKELV